MMDRRQRLLLGSRPRSGIFAVFTRYSKIKKSSKIIIEVRNSFVQFSITVNGKNRNKRNWRVKYYSRFDK